MSWKTTYESLAAIPHVTSITQLSGTTMTANKQAIVCFRLSKNSESDLTAVLDLLKAEKEVECCLQLIFPEN